MNKLLLSKLQKRIDCLPSCLDYANLLDYSHIMTGMDYNDLRDTMGLATYAEWADFLNIA